MARNFDDIILERVKLTYTATISRFLFIQSGSYFLMLLVRFEHFLIQSEGFSYVHLLLLLLFILLLHLLLLLQIINKDKTSFRWH